MADRGAKKPFVLPVLGLSGVGKSTVCHALREARADVDYFSLGDFIAEFLARNSHSRAKPGMRTTRFARLEDYADCLLAFAAKVKKSPKRYALLDSGATLSHFDWGVRCSSFHFWDLLDVSALVLLYAAPEEICRRAQADTQKQHVTVRLGVDQVRTHQGILIAAVLALASRAHLSVSFIENETGAAQRAATALSSAIDLANDEAQLSRLIVHRVGSHVSSS